jgi:quinol monooxygenase YgiN
MFSPEENAMSIRVTLNCQIKSNLYQQLIQFLEDNLPGVRGFKGNLQVCVLFDKEQTEMLLDEEWLSIESHQAYLKYIDENGVMDKLKSFLNSPPQIKYFERKEI